MRSFWDAKSGQLNLLSFNRAKSPAQCYFCLLMDLCHLHVSPFFKTLPFLVGLFLFYILNRRFGYWHWHQTELGSNAKFPTKPKIWIFCDTTPTTNLPLLCCAVKRLQTVFSHRASVILVDYSPPLFSFSLCWINSSRGGHSLQGQWPLTPSPHSRTWHSLTDMQPQ